MEEQDELRPVLLERVELEDHIRERIEFGTLWGFRVPAYVLLPKGDLQSLPPCWLCMDMASAADRSLA